MTKPHCKISARIALDLLWPLVILAGVGIYVSLVPLVPNDFWWHLKIGELIHNTHTIPTTNIFAWTLPADAGFFYGSWLGELLLYDLYRLGGVALPLFVRTAITLLTFGAVTTQARLRCGSWRLAAFALVFAALMSMTNFIVRPQMWSWLPFMAFLLLLERFAAGKLHWQALLLLPLLMVFWVNAHGAFILGLVLLGAFGVGEFLRTALRLPGARSWLELGVLAGISVLTLLAMLINPKHGDIFRYVLGLLTDPPSQQLVVEWQSPTPHGIANITFFVSVLVLFLSTVYSRYRLTPTEVLLVLGFLWLAWSGQRYVIWYGFVTAPLLAHSMSELPVKGFAFSERRNWLNSLLALLLFAPVALVQPWFVESLPLPAAYWSNVWRGIPVGPLVSADTPVAAVEYLKQHPGGNLFHEMSYGSYLIWALPEQGVFVDPRVELYPYEQWLDYVRITQGTRYNELLAAYGADRLLLDRVRQSELITALEDDPLWEQEYADATTQLWRRSP